MRIFNLRHIDSGLDVRGTWFQTPGASFDTSFVLQGLRPRGERPPNRTFAGMVFTPREAKRTRVVTTKNSICPTVGVSPRHIDDSGNFIPDDTRDRVRPMR